jgi:hypothetical protein
LKLTKNLWDEKERTLADFILEISGNFPSEGQKFLFKLFVWLRQ